MDHSDVAQDASSSDIHRNSTRTDYRCGGLSIGERNKHDSSVKEKSSTSIKRMGSDSLGSKPCFCCKKSLFNHCCLAEERNPKISVEGEKRVHACGMNASIF